MSRFIYTTTLCLALAFSFSILIPGTGRAATLVATHGTSQAMTPAHDTDDASFLPILTSGPMVEQGKKKKKKPKPIVTPKCGDIEQICGTPGDARWCTCKEGGSQRTVQCGCKGGGGVSTSPQTPPRTQGEGF